MRDILNELLNKNITVEEAENLLKIHQIEEIEEKIKVDINREVRTGIPEVVYGKNKKFEDIILALNELSNKNNIALATKLKNEHIVKLKSDKKNIIKNYDINNSTEIIINEVASAVIFKKKEYMPKKIGKIGILCGGTSDIPIAEEAKITAEFIGCGVITAYDVGVAGIHRLFAPLKNMIKNKVCCIIVLAGMEGALPSVVAGLTDVPVIGVPISVGYGVGAGGSSALHSMLSSCSPGLTVVNIDNGFGAACFASLIAKQIKKS